MPQEQLENFKTASGPDMHALNSFAHLILFSFNSASGFIHLSRCIEKFDAFSLHLSLKLPDNFELKHLSLRDVLVDKLIAALSISTVATITLPKLCASDSNDLDQVVDKNSGFKIGVFPGWITIPRKLPTPTLSKYQIEEILLVATNFAEGASLSVTRLNAKQLLKDFDIDWWFAPLEKYSDVGSPNLIAELLVLQRQSDFEKKSTPSELLGVVLLGNELDFSFKTPIAEGVFRQTQVKSFFKDGEIISLWISGLSSLFDSDYSNQIKRIADSFAVT